jgi:hypothetical protein
MMKSLLDSRERVTSLVLNRMEIEEAGPNSKRLAEAIHCQLGFRDVAIPVHGIARALDIREIREEPLRNLEAALLSTPERDRGSILINSDSSRQRRRYSSGHELLHFLNEWHEPPSSNGFRCSRQDMLVTKAAGADRHRRRGSSE